MHLFRLSSPSNAGVAVPSPLEDYKDDRIPISSSSDFYPSVASMSPKSILLHSTTNNDNNKKKKKSVAFSTVNIRSYPMILGENPSCREGLPVTIDWDYDETTTTTSTLLPTKTTRNVLPQCNRTTQHQEALLYMSPLERARIIRDTGLYTNKELGQALYEINRQRKEQQETADEYLHKYYYYYYYSCHNNNKNNKNNNNSTIRRGAAAVLKPLFKHVKWAKTNKNHNVILHTHNSDENKNMMNLVNVAGAGVETGSTSSLQPLVTRILFHSSSTTTTNNNKTKE